MKVCIYGAGAMGGVIGAHLARAPGVEVSLVARGAQLEALKRNGLRLITAREDFTVHLPATDDAASLGPQDYVFITLKTHQYLEALETLPALFGPDTAIITPTTSMPYWFFYGVKGSYAEKRLRRVDPGGKQWSIIGPRRAIGCAYWAGAVVPAPGVVQLESDVAYLPLGEPDGRTSTRVTRLSKAMEAGGIKAPVHEDIRSEIWAKMINSLTWNPLAVLTLANNGAMGKSPGVMEIARRMMTEGEAVAKRLGFTMATPMEERIAYTLGLKDHKTSMLADLLAGKRLEVNALVDSVADLNELAGLSTPTIDSMLALLKLRSTTSNSAFVQEHTERVPESQAQSRRHR